MQVEEFLKSQGVDYEKHTHPTTYTAQGLAHVEHVSGYEVAKPVVVRGRENFAMCVLAAPNHLDRRSAAQALHEDDVRLATEAEMVNLFPECELGAEAPIGSLYGMSTVVDKRLLDDEYLVMQAGTHRESIRMRREDWQRICDPVVASISLQ